MNARVELPLPPFYEPDHAGSWEYTPDLPRLSGVAIEWRDEHRIAAAAADRFNLHLLLIDVQKDFCFPRGSLYVAGRSGRGAVEDNRRLAEFIYRNLPVLTTITATFDTHFAHQIFFPSFWVDRDGRPLAPHREITTADIDGGEVRPNPDIARWLCNGDYPWLVRQARHYCEQLERTGKYRLYLWPPHCILGSDGHALAGVIQEARMFHSYARAAQSWSELKGGHPLTENYSALRPEVRTRHDGTPLAEGNAALLDTLLAADALVVAGQASSHCVKSTLEDLLDEISARDRALARKVYVLTDCMSPVTVPDGKGGLAVDFTPQAEQALRRFAEAGMHLVRSTEPLASWPELRLP